MDITVTRGHYSEPGGWFQPPVVTFYLKATVSFTHEERWTVHAHNLYHHVIFDRMPHWYPAAIREAKREEERAKHDGEYYRWPEHIPREPCPEWAVSVARLTLEPAFIVTFDTAAELQHFEARMRRAFENFAAFLRSYGSRSMTIHWRL